MCLLPIDDSGACFLACWVAPGTDLLVAHAELLGSRRNFGTYRTADSEAVTKTLSPEIPPPINGLSSTGNVDFHIPRRGLHRTWNSGADDRCKQWAEVFS